jgi:hypothetical protein
MDLAGQQFELNVAQGLDPREVLAEIPYGNERRHGAKRSRRPGNAPEIFEDMASARCVRHDAPGGDLRRAA